MKQDAFIQRLRQELASLPKQAVDEIVADYREYIGDALAAGRHEEEVIAALGDPAKLAREFKAQASYRQWERHRSFGNLMRVVVSIAGLGLLNVILLVPFMFYLLMLSIGYVLSTLAAIGGLVTVFALGSYHAFGWPDVNASPLKLIGNGGALEFDSGGESADTPSHKRDAADGSDDGKAASSADIASLPTNLKSLKIVGDRYVFTLSDDGDRLALVTSSNGTAAIRRRDGGKLDMNTTGDAGSLLKRESDDSLSIARSAVKVFSLRDENDNRVNVTRNPSDPGKTLWDVHSDDDHVSFEQDEHGESTHIAVKSGSDAVVVDGHDLSIDNKHSHFHFETPQGATLSHLALVYGLVALFGGIVGLLLCVWLTRATWRRLVRYVKRQIDLLSARLETTPAP
ncbi:MAG: DUF1700 domain-containing protein [Pararobbsia sp.]